MLTHIRSIYVTRIQMHSTKSLIEKKGWSKTHHDSHPLRAGALAAPTSAPPVGVARDGSLYGEFQGNPLVRNETLLRVTLQGINISHLGKRKIIFKMPFLGDVLVPWRVIPYLRTISLKKDFYKQQGPISCRVGIVGAPKMPMHQVQRNFTMSRQTC